MKLKCTGVCLIAMLALCAVLATAPGCGGSGGSESGVTLAFVPKSREHSFWLAVIRGAERAAEERGVKLLIQSPTSEDQVAIQIDLVNTLRTEGADGMILAPLNEQALLRPVQDFGKPVVIMDSPLAGEVGKDFASFVGTENKEAGRLAAQSMADLLDREAKVVVLRYIEGSGSTTQREEGFLEAIGTSDNIKVISSNQYAGKSSSTAQDKANAMIDTIRQADGIFTPNQPASIGMLNFLEGSGLAGKVQFVAFDASIELVKGLIDGHVSAIVVQDPETMGYNAVMTMLSVLDGKQVSPHVDTGVIVVTRDNLSDPKIRSILLAYDKLIEPLLPDQDN